MFDVCRSRGYERAMASPDFDPITAKGGGGVDYAHYITIAPSHSDFQTFLRPWNVWCLSKNESPFFIKMASGPSSS